MKSYNSEGPETVSCGRAVVEYLLREALQKKQLEPDDFSWSGTTCTDRLYQLTVWVEDRMVVDFFLQHELVYCFSIPEYYRSIEQKILKIVDELRDPVDAGYGEQGEEHSAAVGVLRVLPEHPIAGSS